MVKRIAGDGEGEFDVSGERWDGEERDVGGDDNNHSTREKRSTTRCRGTGETG